MVKERDGIHLLLEFEPGRTLVNKRQMDLGSTTMVQEFLTKDEWLGMRDSQAEFNRVLSSAPKKDLVEELRTLSVLLNRQSRVKSVTFRVDHQKKNLFGRKETVKLYAQVRKPAMGAPTLVADTSATGSNNRLTKSQTTNDSTLEVTEQQQRRGSAVASVGGSGAQVAPTFPAVKKQAPTAPAQKKSAPSIPVQQTRSPVQEPDNQYMNRVETSTNSASNIDPTVHVSQGTDEGLYQNFTQSRPTSGATRAQGSPTPQIQQQMQQQPPGDSDYVNIDYDENDNTPIIHPAAPQEQDEYMNFGSKDRMQMKNDSNGTTVIPSQPAKGGDVDAYMSYPDQSGAPTNSAPQTTEDDGEYIMYEPKKMQNARDASDTQNQIIGEGSSYMNVGVIKPASPTHAPRQSVPQVQDHNPDGGDLYMNYQDAQKAHTENEQAREGVANIVLSPSMTESHGPAQPIFNQGTLKSQKSVSSVDARAGAPKSKPVPMARPRPASRPKPAFTEESAKSTNGMSNNTLMQQVSQTSIQSRVSPKSRQLPQASGAGGPVQVPVARLFTLDGPTLEKSSCFHGFSADTSRGDRRRAIEEVMDHKPTGCWLLRHDSRGERFVLVVRYIDRTLHIPVDANAGGQFSIDVDKWFDSVEALLGHYHSHELSSTISTMLTNAIVKVEQPLDEPEPDEVDGYFVMSPKARKGI